MILSLSLYYQLPIWAVWIIGNIFGLFCFIQIPVIMEEVIKISAITGPEKLVFSTGLLQVSSQIMMVIMGATMGHFYDSKKPLLTLYGNLTTSAVFLVNIFVTWLMGSTLRKASYYGKLEALRAQEIIVTTMNSPAKSRIFNF